MDAETRQGQALLTGAFLVTRDDAPTWALSQFAGRQRAALEELLPDLPRSTRAEARTSLVLAGQVAAAAEQLLGCVPDCDSREDPHGSPVPAPPGD